MLYLPFEGILPDSWTCATDSKETRANRSEVAVVGTAKMNGKAEPNSNLRQPSWFLFYQHEDKQQCCKSECQHDFQLQILRFSVDSLHLMLKTCGQGAQIVGRVDKVLDLLRGLKKAGSRLLRRLLNTFVARARPMADPRRWICVIVPMPTARTVNLNSYRNDQREKDDESARVETEPEPDDELGAILHRCDRSFWGG